MTEVVHKNSEKLEHHAEKDLPTSVIAEALLEVVATES